MKCPASIAQLREIEGIGEAKTKRILILGTNPSRLQTLRKSLKAQPNTEIKIARLCFSSGILTRSFKPDLVLLDANLKNSNGEIAKPIRTDPELRRAKIITLPVGQNVRIPKIMETM